jgi:tetratricopeptide (TPR) repeat protein
VSIDRAKALKAAQKYLARGQLDKAIGEFESVVATDPKDARSALKLGDLYTRKGDIGQATATYHKVAQQYALEGNFLKAVAVYKQILKMEPGQIAALAGLADTYERLGLVSDAQLTHDQLAVMYTRAGDERQALAALARVTELDASSVAGWVRLGEAMSKAREIDRAADAFSRAADLLRDQGRIDDYMRVAERLLYHRAHDHARARELASIYLDRGDVKAALGRLQACFQANPKDVATLELLARAFLLHDQVPKSLSVLKEIARLHEIAGAFQAQAVVLRQILDLDPLDDDATRALEALGDGPRDLVAQSEVESAEEGYEDMIVVDDGSGVGRPPSTAPPSRPPSAPPPDGRVEEVERLLAESEVFQRYGLREKVVGALRKVLELDPDHPLALQRLRAVEPAEPAGAPVADTDADDEGAIFFDDEPELLLEDDHAPAARPSRPPPAAETGEEPSEDVRQAIEEADFYLQQGLSDDARDALMEALLAHPGSAAIEAKLAEIGAGEQPRGSHTLVVPAGPPLRASLARPSRAPVDVGDALKTFRNEVRSMVPAADTATHYDLGIAYMEMGLHQEAIEEFRICLASGERTCASHSMIGLCHVERGELDEGIAHFARALAAPGITPQEELDLWFEMGNAHELLGKRNDALVWYEKVDERRPGFREANQRIERIGKPHSPQEETEEFDELFDNLIAKE